MSEHYDYFVIGAGSAGVRSARIAAQHGAKVGVAEASDLGGTCVNLGCVPKKLLAYAADYGPHFEDARGFGWDTPDSVSFNWKTLIENKNKEISRLNGIYQNILDKAGVDIIRGYAKLVDQNTLDIDGTRVTADNILIAVGGEPCKSDVPGAEFMVTSDEAFFLEEMPKHVVITGGGYVAVEFAHIFHGLGAYVTLLYRGNLFLRGFDESIRLALANEMRKAGIDLHFNCDIKEVEKKGERFIVHSTEGHEIECDLSMAAIGRHALTANLGLENVGIETTCKGQIEVNDQYQTSVPHIYALGDVSNQFHLTPVAIKEGHVLADRLFGNHPERSVNYDFVATAIFSHPPCATVGLSEEDALAKGHEIMVYSSDFKPMKHTLSGRDERSLMKIIVDHKTDKVLGMHMMGLDAPEIIQGFATALNCGATKADLDRTMAVHPTAAEEFVTMSTGQLIRPSAKS
ncbi:MAG: glutathione-disulfide reductase [Pseudomonadota bacterium]